MYAACNRFSAASSWDSSCACPGVTDGGALVLDWLGVGVVVAELLDGLEVSGGALTDRIENTVDYRHYRARKDVGGLIHHPEQVRRIVDSTHTA